MTFTRRAAVAATALLVLLLALRVAAGAGPPRAATLAAPAPGAAPAFDAAAVVAALDRARAEAYADPAGGDPDAWAARRCPCHAEDARRLRDLARRGLALRGASLTVLAVSAPERRSPEVVEVVVTDRADGYTAVDARGAVVARWPASGVRRWRLTLVNDAGRWLIGALVRAP